MIILNHALVGIVLLLTSLFPIEQHKNWGYIDVSGKVVIEPRFEFADEFAEGFAVVKVDGKYGFIDQSGKFLVEPRYTSARPFSEGLARVQVGGDVYGFNGTWGFIDQTGRMVIEPQYHDPTWASETSYNFHNGLAMIEVNDKKGFINTIGEVVIPPRFDYAYSFSEGLASVCETHGGKWGYIDTAGRWAIPPKFDWASLFSEGLAPVTLNGVCGYIDQTGELKLKPNFTRKETDCASVWGSFDGGLSRWMIGDKYGFINKAGEIVIKPDFELTFNFAERMALIVQDAKYGFIDQTGQLVIKPQFYHARDFHHGLARVNYARDAWGYIDKSGRFVWKQPAETLADAIPFIQTGHTRDLGFVGWSPEGNLIASSAADGWLKIWNPKNGQLIWQVEERSFLFDHGLKSFDGNLVVSRSAKESYEVREVPSGNLIWTIKTHASPERVVSPDKSQIAERGRYGDAVVRLFDARTNQLIRRLEGHPGIIYALAFSPNGKIVASGSGDNTITFWEPKSGALVKSLFGHKRKVTAIAFSGDSQLLVSGSEDDTVKIWNVADWRLERTITSFTAGVGGIKAVAISPDKRFVISGGGTRIQVWDTATGNKISTLETHESHSGPGPHGETMTWCCGSDVLALAYSPDGSLIVSTHDDETIKFWDPEKAEPTRVIKGRFPDVQSVAFSPDGKMIATGYHEGKARVDLWSVQTGELIGSLDKDSDYVQSISFSGDGKLIVTSDIGGDLKLYNVKTGKLVREFKQPYSQGDRVSFSPDGKYFVSGGENQNIMLWEVQTGKLIWSVLPAVP